MKKLLLVLTILISATIIANAEIKMIQIQVNDTPDPQSKYLRYVPGGFTMNDQTSYMLPVKNKRIQAARMPFIKRFGHDVVLVGPFLDVCGEIKIIDNNDNLIFTISPRSFVAKELRNFYFVNENRTRKEGCVHFHIPQSVIRSIRTEFFKIKVGNIENLDVVECQLVKRPEIEAMLFLDTEPQRTATTSIGFPTIKNTFQPNAIHRIAIKLRGEISNTDKFRFGNGLDKGLIYHFDQPVVNRTCNSNLIAANGFKIGTLIKPNDAIIFEVKAKEGGQKTRRINEGYMIGLSDANMGQFVQVIMDENADPDPVGTVRSKMEQPDCWGPYIFARILPDVYTFGRYTDLGIIEIGECKISKGGGGFAGIGDNTRQTQFPDLVPEQPKNLFRGSVRDFCNGITDVNKPSKIEQDSIIWGVENVTNVPVTRPFTIEIYNDNGDLLARQVVAPLPGFGVARFKLGRPVSTICVQLTDNRVCAQCDPEKSNVPLWIDPKFKIIVDTGLNVEEGGSETNNTKEF
jgi:hypothetical protein